MTAILERKIGVSATYIKRALRLLVEHGEAPDESGYRALEAMRGYIEAAQTVYQEGAGTMLAGTVIERPLLSPPAPEPVPDLLAEALRLGAIVGITAATTRRAAPATPERTWTPSGGKWGGERRVADEEDWDAAPPKRAQARIQAGAGPTGRVSEIGEADE